MKTGKLKFSVLKTMYLYTNLFSHFNHMITIIPQIRLLYLIDKYKY